jgi:hypothetical protein
MRWGLPSISQSSGEQDVERGVLGGRAHGHASAATWHPRHRHRCRHGSSSTHAPAAPHDLQALARHRASAPPCSCSKQHDRASSASPSAPAPSPSVAHGDWRRLSSVARRPAEAASWLLATPCHACASATVSRSLAFSSALRASARPRSASAARRRRAAARSAADTMIGACRRRNSCSPARSRSVCPRRNQ